MKIKVVEYRRDDEVSMRLVGPDLWCLVYYKPLGEAQAAFCWDSQESRWVLLDLVEEVVKADYSDSDLVQYAMSFKQAYQNLLTITELPT